METKDKRPLAFLGRMSNDSFISLFMLGVLIVIFGLACAIVPNFFTPKNVVNICDTIYLLYDGNLKSTMRNGCDLDSERILNMVTGGE